MDWLLESENIVLMLKVSQYFFFLQERVVILPAYYSCDGGGLCSLSKIAFGEGFLGYLKLIVQHKADAPAMMMNIPNQPKAGLRNSVMTAITGAAAA